MIPTGTIAAALAAADAERPALAAPGREGMSHGALRRQIETTVSRLNALGIGRGDAIAIVLPNGPEMASAFLSVAAAAVTAPLNPAYRDEEFDFYLGDLEARALVILAGMDSPVRAVAARRGVPIIELSPQESGPAGAFRLEPAGAAPGPAKTDGPAGADDIGLILHTSGTTSRPKMVPLAQRNLVASAGNIGRMLQLGRDDRCMNIMPLFHIHGLVAAVLSSLAAGGSTYCTPGFNALKFFSWLDDASPSWYSAVPTMHQAILGRAERNADIVARRRLRFIRSSSSSLPPQVMAGLEQTFGCPVIESYGMTEASHQMTSNPLPPRARKPGSVGVAAGPEVRVIGEDERPREAGEIGEVVIRGPNVTAGYLENPAANATAFTRDGWFRTGDQGAIDAEGYLTLTGRLKEIINRGGEKISPREIDEVLLDHPAIGQAVTFALPHDKLGEDVAAAVVLKEGAEAGEREIRDFVAGRLADFKVPRKIVFLPEIPKGATGKLQRIGLAKVLGLSA